MKKQRYEKPLEDFNYNLDAYLKQINDLASRYTMSVESVIAAANVLELRRRNDIANQDSVIWDEQLGGLVDTLVTVQASIKAASDIFVRRYNG